MTTCYFLGHENPYDLDLFQRIKGAVNSIVIKEDSINFIFYRTGVFFSYCLAAVLEAKQTYPKKTILMTRVTEDNEEDEERKLMLNCYQLPRCVFDKIFHPLAEKEVDKATVKYWKRVERTLIRQSKYLICYHYPKLRDFFSDTFSLVVKQPDLQIINLASEETTYFVQEAVNHLPISEKTVIEKVDQGYTMKNLADEAGVTVTAIRAKDTRGRMRLRALASERYQRQQGLQGFVPFTCAAVLPVSSRKMGSPVISNLRCVMSFLIRSFNVRTFLIEQNDCPSALVGELKWLTIMEGVKLVVATHFASQADADQWSMENGYIPPICTIMNFDPDTRVKRLQYLKTIAEMMNRSQFLICAVDEENPMNNGIQQCIKKHKNTILFDIQQSTQIEKEGINP
ncbi:MAG: hypothetical protein HFJ79_05040 [Clostridiales bacterium]|nr:hypothetical protein [Clostridiales bacterium]